MLLKLQTGTTNTFPGHCTVRKGQSPFPDSTKKFRTVRKNSVGYVWQPYSE